MTNDEFTKFASRLFVAFPGLWEWLQSNSPDPRATQEVWRETLRPYSYLECLDVLECWTSGKLKPFEAYERDKVHLIIRAIIARNRDNEAKRRASREQASEYRCKMTAMDIPGVADAFKKGREVYLAFVNGEITEDEKVRRCKEIVDSVL